MNRRSAKLHLHTKTEETNMSNGGQARKATHRLGKSRSRGTASTVKSNSAFKKKRDLVHSSSSSRDTLHPTHVAESARGTTSKEFMKVEKSQILLEAVPEPMVTCD